MPFIEGGAQTTTKKTTQQVDAVTSAAPKNEGNYHGTAYPSAPKTETAQPAAATDTGHGTAWSSNTSGSAASGTANQDTRAYRTGNVLSGPTFDDSTMGGVDTSSSLPKNTDASKTELNAAWKAASVGKTGGTANGNTGGSASSLTNIIGNGSTGNGSTDSSGSTGSSGGGSSGSGSSGNGTGYTDAELLAQALRAAGVDLQPYQMPEISGPNAERLEHVDTAAIKDLLQQIVDSQKQQSEQQIDYSVEQGVNELTRAMEDAATQYQTQRNQATADEMRALDNQALYNEARGDRGGIGAAQYASIQAAAAQNRRAVNEAQTKLGTDTSRQIADLRSKGEFQKADQLLSITQSYLKDLMGLEQWALEANLGVDEFNSRLQQWVDEYNLNVQQFLTDLDLSAAQLTGVFANGNRTLAAQNQLRDSLASSGSALLSAGVLPSQQQLEAMGMTEVQAKAYLKKTGK